MSPLNRVVFACWLAAAPIAFAQDAKPPKDFPKLDMLLGREDESKDVTRLRKIADRTYVFDDAKVSYTVPLGWKEIKPQRLARKIDPEVSIVLRIEEPEKDVGASLYWIPMPANRKLSDWVRDTPIGGEYGEEFETLKAIYGGPPRITIPTRIKSGPFDVYRIGISAASERGERYDGVLYVFEAKAGEKTWLVKARVSYPAKPSKGEETSYEALAKDVLAGFSNVAERVSSEGK